MNVTENTISANVGLLSLTLAGCITTPTDIVNSKSQTMMTNRAVETEQQLCFSTTDVIDCPDSGEYFGQDAQITGNSQSYTVHGNGTVTDNITGLMWLQSPDTNGDHAINQADKLSSSDAVTYCETLDYAGYTDWLLPNIKQSYSLINFHGTDPDPMAKDTYALIPFVDTEAFDFTYGNPQEHERVIDSQYASTSKYVNDEGEKMLFGVNLADGRIKGYGENSSVPPKPILSSIFAATRITEHRVMSIMVTKPLQIHNLA